MELLLLFLLWLAPANTPKPIEVTAAPRIALAPSDVRVRIRVEPHTENRLLVVVLAGDNYYRSSQIPLDGDKEATTHERSYIGVRAPGHYMISAILQRQGEKVLHAETTVCLAGLDVSC